MSKMRWSGVAAALVLAAGASAPLAAQTQLPAGVTARDIEFYSEWVLSHGRLFLPPGFSATGSTPAVVLAPGMAQTAATVERVAVRLAADGIAALAIDYRGWGRSGAFIYVDEGEIRTDDRLRFSQHTANVTLRRRRLAPEAQLLDLRNAITFLQGEAGIDPARIGVWGTDLGGGHAVALAGIDNRVNVVVAEVPRIAGHGEPRLSFAPSPEIQADMIRLARTGPAAVTTPEAAGTMQDPEARVALAQYRPFHMIEQIPETVAIRFIIAERDDVVDNATNAVAASAALRGPTDVIVMPGADHALSGAAAEAAARAAVQWFKERLQ